MVWRCPDCGVVNDDASPKCGRSACGYDRVQLKQHIGAKDSKGRHFKHPEAADVAVAFFLVFVSGTLLTLIFSDGLAMSCAWVAAECVGIWVLSRRHPLRPLFALNLGGLLAYGCGIGMILFGVNLFSYVDISRIIPSGHDVFVKHGNFYKWLFCAVSVVVSPVVEETLFRGQVYKILRHRYNVILATIVSVMLFTVLHGGFDPGVLLLGIAFTFVYEKTQSIWGSAAAHALSNFGYLLFHHVVA